MTSTRSTNQRKPVIRYGRSEAARLFGAGLRKPSGPAVMTPHQQAGHMIALVPLITLKPNALTFKEPSTKAHPARHRHHPTTNTAVRHDRCFVM